jgi:hypothetical protein
VSETLDRERWLAEHGPEVVAEAHRLAEGAP